ncbi:MAG: hypothetical protein R2712_18995 [Vicinamibacterales bacterium]
MALSALCACAQLGPGAQPTAASDTLATSAVLDELTLVVGASADASGATITFVRVSEDSRCPTGTTCIWAGDAIVELRVARAGSSARQVTLHANEQRAREELAAGLRIALVRLDPYPSADGPIAPDAYRATLSVSPE